MSEKPKILMVDDEHNLLASFRRTLSSEFEVFTAMGGREALRVMDERGPFPVVVTDMRMPEMDGVAFVCAARTQHKDTVYMMLTGNADQQTAMDAINKGHVFRFLNKPCPPEALKQTLLACARQYELQQSERVLFRDTLSGAVKLLVEMIALSDPGLQHAVAAIRGSVIEIGNELGIAQESRLPLAASLCLIGGLVVAGREGRDDLSEEYLETCAQIGSKLLRRIKRLEEVAQIIERQREVGPLPEQLDSPEPAHRIQLCSQVLRFAMDLQRATLAANGNRGDALERLAAFTGNYDPRLVQAAKRMAERERLRTSTRLVSCVAVEVVALRPNMTLAQDVKTNDGKQVMSNGQPLSDVHIELLRKFAELGYIEDVVVVLFEEAVSSPPAGPAQGHQAEPGAGVQAAVLAH